MSLSKERFLEITNSFHQLKPILVVGDIGIDKYTYGRVQRISPEAPVPVLEVEKEWEKLGLAANVSDNLKSLDIESTLCGVIGDDAHGSALEGLLENTNLKTWGIVRAENRLTTYKERVVTGMQQICRVDYETKDIIDSETLERLTTRLADFKKTHNAIIVEDYGKGMVTKPLLEYLINEYNDAGNLIAVDPSRTTPPDWYAGVDLLKPNQVEAELMVKALGYNDETNIEQIVKILCDKLKLKKIIVTMGSEGMALLDVENNEPMKIIPTVASEVFDVSGAGDTAISAIVGAMEAGASLEEAAWIGNCAAGVVVGKKGTAKVDRTELANFFDKLSLKK